MFSASFQTSFFRDELIVNLQLVLPEDSYLFVIYILELPRYVLWHMQKNLAESGFLTSIGRIKKTLNFNVWLDCYYLSFYLEKKMEKYRIFFSFFNLWRP